MVLYGIVSATWEAFSNDGPAVASAINLGLENDAVLVFRPGCLGDCGVEMVMPSLTALFANATCSEFFDAKMLPFVRYFGATVPL